MPHLRELSKEDSKRVDSVLHSGYNSIERRPFKFWKFLLCMLGLVALMAIVAILIQRQVLIVIP